MMKYLPVAAILLFLTGCVGDRSDLELFVTTTKAQHVARIPPLKKTTGFRTFCLSGRVASQSFCSTVT